MLLLEALLVAILHQIQGNIYIAIKLERSKLIKQSNKVPAHDICSHGNFFRFHIEVFKLQMVSSGGNTINSYIKTIAMC